MSSGIVYSAATVSRILGLSADDSDPIPQAKDDEIVIYFGGWTLKQLRTCAAGKVRLRQVDNWYDGRGRKADPGYYRLLLPVPGSNQMSWSEQIRHLATIDSAWQPAPVCIAATALLVHLTETWDDFLKGGICRCAELPAEYVFRFGLTVNDGCVRVNCIYTDEDCGDDLWLAAFRKF